ncbi:hypothetical protein QQS21_011275 [Conoideocrella luteorostrata]|uniref:Uncharacterized protein n=1 Tax=Conoideocrella luteorostrata TaxID=1105319 RepID=A0AAJ0FTW3_9HYPO|nr:hypothetical protein QQS21_011275 [Conoideocrella luteorostrata]
MLVMEEFFGSSRRRESGKEDVVRPADDAASNTSDALNDDVSDCSLPSLDALIRAMDEARKRVRMSSDGELMPECEHAPHCKDQRRVTSRPASSAPPDDTMIRPSPERMSGEPAADRAAGDSSCASCISAPASASMPATSRTVSASPRSQSGDTASSRASRASTSAADEITDEQPNMQSATQRRSPHVVENDPGARETCKRGQPAAVPSWLDGVRQRLRLKRQREASLGHDDVWFDAEDRPGPLGDAEHCQSTGHEAEESRDASHEAEESRDAGHEAEESRDAGHEAEESRDAGHEAEESRDAGHEAEESRDASHEPEEGRDGHFADDDEPPRKRRKHGPIRSTARSLSEDGACHDSPDVDQAADAASSTAPKHSDTTELVDAAFDEWNPLHLDHDGGWFGIG